MHDTPNTFLLTSLYYSVGSSRAVSGKRVKNENSIIICSLIVLHSDRNTPGTRDGLKSQTLPLESLDEEKLKAKQTGD